MWHKVRAFLAPRTTWSYCRQVPILASLELTYRCNLKCQMCNLWSDYHGRRHDELSLNDWQNIIDGLAALKTRQVSLIGAEPLIRDDIVQIARYIKSKGLTCVITTNGTLLQAMATALVSAGVDAVNISIDAPGVLHDKIRGISGTFDRAMAGIKSLVKARRPGGRTQPWISIHTTISATNVAVIAEMASSWKDLGADGCHFGYLVEVPHKDVAASILDGQCVGSRRLSPMRGQSFLLTAEQLILMKQQLDTIQHQDRSDMGLNVFRCLPDSYFLTGRLPVRKCYTLRTRIIVNPYGDVIPCPFLDGYVIGNIRETSVIDIWHSERYQKLRRKVEEKLFPVCSYCCYFSHNLTRAQAFQLAIGRSLKV